MSVLISNTSKLQNRIIQLGSEDIEVIDTESPPASAPQRPGIANDNKFLIYGGWILFGVTFIFFIIFLLARRRKREN